MESANTAWHTVSTILTTCIDRDQTLLPGLPQKIKNKNLDSDFKPEIPKFLGYMK